MTMSQDFHGRRIVITGGSGALGSAVVNHLAALGTSCEITWVSESEQKHQTPGERMRYTRVDVTDERQVTDFYARFDDLWGSIHLVGGFAMSPIADTSADEFEKMFRLNALSCFLCCREATRAIRRSSATRNTGGRIVNVAARPAVAPVGGMISYSASKSAVASITQSLAIELQPEGILVNAVVPSIMDTPANRRSMPNSDFSTWPKVEQVAQAIAFLASPENALTSGVLLPVYGRA